MPFLTITSIEGIELMTYDCAIVGGGPAGLNAALVLGRARRSVLLLDNSQPRNGVAQASHGFISRDGIQPAEFRRIAYQEVLRYPSVQHWKAEVTALQRTQTGFVIQTSSREQAQARKIILAAGLKEVFPEIEGFRQFYGTSLFNCPYCDGWELRDRPVAVISASPGIFHTAKLVLNWSRDLIVCTNGRDNLHHEQRRQLAMRGIRIIDTPVAAFSGSNGLLERVHFSDRSSIARSGGIISPALLPNARFHETLGYQIAQNGGIVTDAAGRSTAFGVYAAGDSAYVTPSQQIYAAASGSRAAMAVIGDLIEEDWQSY